MGNIGNNPYRYEGYGATVSEALHSLNAMVKYYHDHAYVKHTDEGYGMLYYIWDGAHCHYIQFSHSRGQIRAFVKH
jgi:hypothetical protein